MTIKSKKIPKGIYYFLPVYYNGIKWNEVAI